MATPVGNNAVAAVWTVPPTTVTDNGMIGNLFGDRHLINCHNEAIVRGQGVHAIGKTLHLQRRRVGGKRFAQGPTDREELRWRFNKHRADATDPIAGQVAATMRRGHEHYAPNIAPVLEDENLFEQVLTLGVHRGLGRRMSESFEPES